MVKIFASFVFFCSAFLLADITELKIPFEAKSLDAKFDKKGNLHLLFAKNSQIFYSIKKKNKRTFSSPINIDPNGPEAIIAGKERRPFLAIDPKHYKVI